MGLAKRVSDIIPTVDGGLNFVRELWDRLSTVPGGKAVFSKAIGRAAPYTGSIDARVRQLQRGFAQVTMNDKRGLRNHLKSVHAVALVNLVELTGNLALAYSLPDDARFIVAGLSVDYLKKARGTITAESVAPIVENADKKEFLVEVVLRDERDEVVVRGTLKTLVGPKPSKK